MADTKLKTIEYYRKYPVRFVEDCLGLSLTKTQKIFMNQMMNTNRINKYFIISPRWSGRKFYYDALNQIREILFGESDLKDNNATITVVNMPSHITCHCPHCGEEIKIPYLDFLNMISEYYYGDWIGDTFECPECEEEIEIKDVDWD